jgi:acyl-CoA thioesterase
MAAGDLDRALAVRPIAEGQWAVRADPHYEAANGMFGGWAAAIALRAVAAHDDSPARPSALTVNFVRQILPGTELVARTRCVGASRSVSHWLCELDPVDGDETFATASIVLTTRRDTDAHIDVVMPDSPEPDTVDPVFPIQAPGGGRLSMRPIDGFPPFGRTSTESTAWVRDLSGRAVDHAQLAFLADHRPPRSWYWGEGPRPSATLTLSVWFHATDDELAAVGDDEVLSEAFGVRGAQATSEEHARLWSRSGVLLASSVQLAWYR